MYAGKKKLLWFTNFILAYFADGFTRELRNKKISDRRRELLRSESWEAFFTLFRIYASDWASI